MSAEATRGPEPAAWSVPSSLRRRTPVLLTAMAVAALAGSAWWATDRWYAADARQQAADRWAQLQRCVLGNGLAPDERPGKRLARIALAIGEAPAADDPPWPERCRPYAEGLDAALARPALRGQFDELPTAVAAVSSDTPLAERSAALDALWRGLRAADLPLPSTGAGAKQALPIPAAPQPAAAALRLRELAPMAGAAGSELLDQHGDSSSGRELRLLFAAPGEQPLSCSVGDGAEGKLWGAAQCRALGWALPKDAGTIRLSHSEAGAPALIYARGGSGADGFFDPASGQRIWRPRFADAQAFVRQSGETTIVYAVPREGAIEPNAPTLTMGSARVDHYRLVRLTPGRAPSNRRLEVPTESQLLLLGTRLLWWHPGDRGDVLHTGGLREGEVKLRAARRLGVLPRGSRLASACNTKGATALLFQSARHDSAPAPSQLVLLPTQGQSSTHELGALPQPTRLACEDEAVTVTARREGLAMSLWSCTSESCTGATSRPLPWIAQNAELLTTHSVGGRPLIVWTAPDGGLRLRTAETSALAHARDRVLLDPKDVARLKPRSLQVLSNRGVALLLIRSASQGIFALRIERSGAVAPLRVDS